MVAQALFAFFLVLYLRKRVRVSAPGTPWEKTLTIALIAIVGLFIIESVFHISFITRWIWNLFLVLLVFITYREKVFAFSRGVMIAVIPVIFILLLKDFVAALDLEWLNVFENYLNYADPIAGTWMIAMLFVANRQQKLARKEQQKHAEEEAKNKIIAARRAELETLVLERTAELTQQKEELQHALTDLKATQAQLVHREKMASLGELTAGIAHEIQNPLNFINNFAELNAELTEELTQEIEALPAAADAKQHLLHLIADLQQNEQKINGHGRRADSIVKGMLLHSRKTTGAREWTNINALADEYLRLSYHGLRAKDKSFNATLQTHFDEAIGNIHVVPQDMGRVLLNLFNNSFYAVHQKKKTLEKGYEPTVTVTTKKEADQVEIIVQDNGMGISKSLQDKIFQPFFTTKPTGQGTGLGLSLSYDVVKAHGGKLQVESKEGEGATFTIQLPTTE